MSELVGKLSQGVEYYKGDPGPKGDTGPRGEKGEPFRFEDFTPEQLESLKVKGDTGPAGEPGQKGDKGDAFTYADFTQEQLEALRGPQGIQGVPGETGPAGQPGQSGKDGVSVSHTWNGTSLSITSASGTSEMDLRGPIGPAGQNGQDYVLTQNDKTEIANMVKVPKIDRATIIQKPDGTISTAIGGSIIPSEEMFAWEGSLILGGTVDLSDISVFKDQFSNMNGDTVIIIYVFNNKEYADEYEIATDGKAEVVFTNGNAKLTGININLNNSQMTIDGSVGGEMSGLIISTREKYNYLNANFILTQKGLTHAGRGIAIDESYINNLIASYIKANITNAEGVNV